MKRTFFIILLFIFTAVCAQQVKFEVQWYPQAQFAGYIMALEKGFFKQNGLEVELLFSDGSDEPLQKMKDGDIDFCSAWLSAALKKCESSNRLVNIYQVLQKSSLMFVAKKSSNITKPADFNGKRIGLWGGDFILQPTAFFRKYDIDYEKIPQSYNIDGFLVGAWEVASAMYYNEYHKIYQAGVDEEELTSFFFADYGLNFPEDGIYCKLSTLQENEETAIAFVNAVQKGWQYAFQNKQETLDIVMQYCREQAMRTNRAHQKWMLDKIEEAYYYSGSENQTEPGVLPIRDYYRVAEELKEQGFLPKIPRYKSFFKRIVEWEK